MYEWQIPVERDVKWWTPGRMELDNAPQMGWRAIVYRSLVRCLRWIGCKVLLDHETYKATRVETIKRDTLHHLLYDVYMTMMKYNERPWMVLVPYEMMTGLRHEYFKDYFPHTVSLGRQGADVRYGMQIGRQRYEFTVGPDIPVYACPWVETITIVPDIRDAEQYRPFGWVLREVQDFYERDRFPH